MMNEPGVLYITGTPIGNMSDMSPRAVEILKTVDLIAAEDTRNTGILLKKFSIECKLISYHEHNIVTRGEYIAELLLSGKSVALVSDAGMPCISDPGYELVRVCKEKSIKVCVIPGPCAAITALCGSGLDSSKFTFEGFIPAKGKDRKIALSKVIKSQYTVIIYEAPHRIIKTLEALSEAGISSRKICLARELTKKFEEFITGNAEELLAHFMSREPKGEFVLIIEGASEEKTDTIVDKNEDILNDISEMLKNKIKVKEISANISEKYGISKNIAYNMVIKSK